MCCPRMIACILYLSAAFNMLTAFVLLVLCVLAGRSRPGGKLNAILFLIWMLIHIPLILGVLQRKRALMWAYIIAWPLFFSCVTILLLLIYCSVIVWYDFLRFCWPLWFFVVWFVTAIPSWILAISYLSTGHDISTEASSTNSAQS
ncbi:uncharacterized protein [Drosophila pseudoobscura]|uniref:Uncharacterized protein isoform X1 n=1 Tax=Drosophila pseudoobscura pseudoobscura TaxID=46245 RepID=A0A6I8V4T7_DROPS|nr:uncharacterized protein LOC6898929 isoform X1 [Drosophila pseudoobscura]